MRGSWFPLRAVNVWTSTDLICTYADFRVHFYMFWWRMFDLLSFSLMSMHTRYIYFFWHTSTFQLLDKPWAQASSLLRPGSCLHFFYRVQGSAIPLLVEFSSSAANSRSRVFRKSICAQEKVPTNFTSMHSGGFELTKLIYTRLEDNLIRHRGDRVIICIPNVSSSYYTKIMYASLS